MNERILRALEEITDRLVILTRKIEALTAKVEESGGANGN